MFRIDSPEAVNDRILHERLEEQFVDMAIEGRGIDVQDKAERVLKPGTLQGDVIL